ncbi:pentapeptide repeat-containing protein [Streptomyces rubiginosohelvolus]|uniref:pentapeptide repeat-containing protein n=1 Tax=Streptomyces rubiginosohelvolus TaxID=67362 RepID=UPI0033BE8825
MDTPDTRRSTPTRAPLKALSWQIVICCFLAACCVTAATTLLLVKTTAARNPDEAKVAAVKISAIRTGLSVGAGAGGAMALLLAARRQWLGERTQAHQEEVSENEIMDATERRITDLYGKAVDQLGSDKAAVRIGGILALERLAQANSGHRQTITDVICAYLRMPFPIPSSIDLGNVTQHTLQESFNTDEERQEFQVRTTAQGVLKRHLSHHSKDTGDFWSDLRLDLTGATLVTLNLANCEWDNAVFAHARFVGTTRFKGSESFGDSIFRGARFYGFTDFMGTSFAGLARFDDVKFERSCDFTEATFDRGARFDRASFSDQANYTLANFYDKSTFDDSTFQGEAIFSKSHFLADAQFMRATFGAKVRFVEATFGGTLTISETSFEKDARFSKAHFEGRLRVRNVNFTQVASFAECRFDYGISFRKVAFAGTARFSNSLVLAGASFRETIFEKEATFTGAPNSQTVSFYGAQFNDMANFHSSNEGSFKFENCSTSHQDSFRPHPCGWLISSNPSPTGRFEVVRWYAPLMIP